MIVGTEEKCLFVWLPRLKKLNSYYSYTKYVYASIVLCIETKCHIMKKTYICRLIEISDSCKFLSITVILKSIKYYSYVLPCNWEKCFNVVKYFNSLENDYVYYKHSSQSACHIVVAKVIQRIKNIYSITLYLLQLAIINSST